MQRTFSLRVVSVSLVAIVSLFLLAVAVLPAYAQTSPKENCTISGRAITVKTLTYNVGDVVGPVGAVAPVTKPTADWGTVCLINTINSVVDWIFLFLLVISVALIAIAGFMWMTSGGDAAKTKTAGQMIVAALIGIVIAILARVFPAVVLSILG